MNRALQTEEETPKPVQSSQESITLQPNVSNIEIQCLTPLSEDQLLSLEQQIKSGVQSLAQVLKIAKRQIPYAIIEEQSPLMNPNYTFKEKYVFQDTPVTS